MSTLTATVEALAGINPIHLRAEVEHLEAIRDWAVANCGADYSVGDRVVIVADFPRTDGWAAWRDPLAKGATGVVKRIDFAASQQAWYAHVQLDRDFSATSTGTYWHGRADETPAGMIPPTVHEQTAFPSGKRHVFALRVEWVHRCTGEVTS